MELGPTRGTRDFYPDEMRLRSWLFAHFRAVAAQFGFEEYDAPVVESEELYIRKAGEEITEQLYSFEDKSGRRLALRPEMTPSLARLVLQKGGSLALPVKWFSLPQCWRYERMTRGRKREHYQWNMDILGVAEASAEAELLAAVVAFFERVGLTNGDVGIKVSSRKLLQGLVAKAGVPDPLFPQTCVVVDKRGKIPNEALLDELAKLGLDVAVARAALEVTQVPSLDEARRVLGADHAGVAELQTLFDLAGHYGYADYLAFDPSVVRGLVYYTGIVFEGFDRGATLRAICGGGRYDRLLSSFGGADVPACGFGFGDVVIVELLRDKGLIPDLQPEGLAIVHALDPGLRGAAAEVAARLRRAGKHVDFVLEDRKLKWVFSHAERRGAKRLILVGSAEWAKGHVRIKDLHERTERDVAIAELDTLV